MWWAAREGNEKFGLIFTRCPRHRRRLKRQTRPNSHLVSLPLASAYGHDSVVRLLLERDGIDYNSTGKDGRTPLRWAAYAPTPTAHRCRRKGPIRRHTSLWRRYTAEMASCDCMAPTRRKQRLSSFILSQAAFD